MADPLFADIVAQLAEDSDGEALLADGFDAALIGTAEGWFNNSRRVVALYDLSICLKILADAGMTYDEATEWVSYNTLGAFAGPSTPVFAVIRRQPVVVYLTP